MKLGRLSEKDLTSIENIIFQSYSKNLLGRGIEFKQSEFKELGDYHETSASLNHSRIWSKRDRMLERADVHQVEKILSAKISGVLGDYSISDEEVIGFGNIYWRLVRPYIASDVGPAHRDSWFWHMNPDQPMPEGTNQRYKVWIPLIAKKGVNTLAVISGSQADNNVEYVCRKRQGLSKPFPIKPFRRAVLDV